MKKVKDKWAPLSAGFMMTSIIGFIISIWFISSLSATWGFTLTFFFIIMFFASMISMTKAEPIPEHMNTLAIHDHKKAYKPFLKEQKLEPVKNKWYEPIYLVYLVLWFYYIIMYLTGKIFYTNEYIAIIFMMLTVAFALIFLIDVFSRSIYLWKQFLFALLIIITTGYGVLFFPIATIGTLAYYIYLKINTK